MNRFRIARGNEEDFETLWRERDSHEAASRAWTESESLKKAHAQARATSGTSLGHPVFEGFEAIL